MRFQQAHHPSAETRSHGFRAVGVGVATDLRASGIVRSTQAFTDVLRDGLLVAGGMPQFDELDDDQIKDLQQYIRAEAYQATRGSDGAREKP